MAEKKPEVQEGVRPGPRECLRCHHWFSSQGIHNRICFTCRTKKPYQGLDELAVGVNFPDNFKVSDMKIVPVRPTQ